MRLDKLTVKAQEAIQAAQSLADQGSHQAVEPEHLLAGSCSSRRAWWARCSPSSARAPTRSRAQVQTEIEKLPAVRGGAGSNMPPSASRA